VTAAESIVNGIIYLDRHREMRRQLILEPERVRNFAQDIVRWGTPAIGVARTVTRDTVLGGCKLRRGDRILAMLGSANFDDSVFPDPTQISITDNPVRHLGFGLGVHFCPGAPLARLEIEKAL